MTPAVSVLTETDTRLNSPFTVNRFDDDAPTTVADRLDGLAQEHRAAVVRKGMRAARVQGDLPDPATLAAAEHPPAPRWRSIALPDPCPRHIADTALATINSVAWREKESLLRPRSEQLAEATRQATAAAWTAWAAIPRREMQNPEEWEAGQALAARWGDTIRAIHELLDDAEQRIPDLYLAATPEGTLREIAKVRAAMAEAMQDDIDEDDLTPAMRRERDPAAQVRTLRKRAAKARQAAAALFGTVGRGGADYADTYSVGRWRERQEAAKKWAEGRDVRIEVGGKIISVPLTEVMASGATANLAQLYAMHLGIDDHARSEGLTAVFMTLTLPPEYHPNPSVGHQGWNPDLLPDAADAALMRLWARFRARLKKASISPYGLRVIEPHRDGCPHLHALLYVQPEAVARVDGILQAIRPEPVPGRRAATTLTVIDITRASAPTYVLKYILKARNDGAAAARAAGQHDGEDGDHLASHDAIRAWASERSIRRFAWVGLHGVNAIWRAIRNRKEIPAHAPAAFHEAHAALHTGRYADALDAMGALRNERPRMRLAYEEVENRYGEQVKRAVGVRLTGEPEDAPIMALRKHRASIVSRAEEAAEQDYEAAVRAARAVQEMGESDDEQGGAVTVIISSPRAPHDGGCEGEAGGRTGPPAEIVDVSSVQEAQILG